MFLPANSFVNFGLVLTDLSPHYGSNFLVFYCMPFNFDWKVDIVNFTLVSDGDPYIPINFLEFYSGTQLLKTV